MGGRRGRGGSGSEVVLGVMALVASVGFEGVFGLSVAFIGSH